MLSAVVSAVSVTQVLRALFETGWPCSSLSAASSSLVPAGSSGFAAETNRPISAYVRPPVCSITCERMIFANARAWSPVFTGSPAHCSAYFATAGSSAVPNVIPSCSMLSRTVTKPFTPRAMETAPKTTRTPPARNPPISQYLLPFIAPPPGWLSLNVDGASPWPPFAPLGEAGRRAASNPPTQCGEVRSALLLSVPRHDQLAGADALERGDLQQVRAGLLGQVPERGEVVDLVVAPDRGRPIGSEQDGDRVGEVGARRRDRDR